MPCGEGAWHPVGKVVLRCRNLEDSCLFPFPVLHEDIVLPIVEMCRLRVFLFGFEYVPAQWELMMFGELQLEFIYEHFQFFHSHKGPCASDEPYCGFSYLHSVIFLFHCILRDLQEECTSILSTKVQYLMTLQQRRSAFATAFLYNLDD